MIYLQLVIIIKTTYRSLDFWRIISFSILSLKISAYILAPFCVKWMQSWLIILWLSVNTLTELPDMLPKMIEDNCNNSNRLQHTNKDKSVFHISLLFSFQPYQKSISISKSIWWEVILNIIILTLHILLTNKFLASLCP